MNAHVDVRDGHKAQDFIFGGNMFDYILNVYSNFEFLLAQILCWLEMWKYFERENDMNMDLKRKKTLHV